MGDARRQEATVFKKPWRGTNWFGAGVPLLLSAGGDLTTTWGNLEMTTNDARASAVTPDGFHLEPTYEHMVAETGFDPEVGAAAPTVGTVTPGQ